MICQKEARQALRSTTRRGILKFAGLFVLASVFYHPLFLAAVAAHLSHVITEHLHNNMSPLGYSIIYRIINRFNASVIAPRHNPSDAYWQILDVLPYGKRLAPWFK
jgi:hypothetical protein